MQTNHLNQEQLAHRWRLSISTLERWRSEGKGPVFLKIGARVVYREHDVEQYEQGCLRRSTGQRLRRW